MYKMASNNLKRRKTFLKMGKEYDFSIEVVILMVFAVFMLIFGFLLFKIHTGDLPYAPDSTYGLFLVIVSFQIITMGKTPFGDFRRSWALIIIGICAAIIGMVACFVPGYLSGLVRMLVGIILFAGGIALLVQLFASKEKAKTWMKVPGILRQLTIACGLVYAITLISGLITLFPGITTDPQTALVLIIYGISFFYLSWCIHKVSKVYPEETDDLLLSKLNSDSNKSKLFAFFQETSLNLTPAILLLLGVLLALLGVLLFPVNMGLIPFSPDGQLGLLLVIIAIQMMALGSTPVGQYNRSWLLILIGIVFAALGIFSCIVPGLLTDVLRIFLGILNILGGVILLIKQFLPKLYEISKPSSAPGEVPPIAKKLSFTQTLLNFVAIVFGLTMLLPYLIPGLIMAGILVINGILLFLLASLLQKVTMVGIIGEQPAENSV